MERLVHLIIFGKKEPDISYASYKSVILSGQYCVLSFLVFGVYVAFDIIDDRLLSNSFYIYTGGVIVIGVALWAHRKNKSDLANYLLFGTLNTLLFALASSEPVETYAFIFYFPIAMGAYSLFNYSKRKTALLFAVISFTLAMITLFTDWSPVEFRVYSASYILVNQVINFSVAFFVSVLVLYMLVNVNYASSKTILESNEQLEKLNTELDRFVYSASHDLRAPLLSVQGLLQLADHENVNETVKRYHEMMLKRLVTLDKFVKDITDYSRNNRIQVVNEKVNARDLLNEIWDTLKFSDQQRVRIVNDLPPELVIDSDLNRLRVVFSNLIANAIRYHDSRKADSFIRIAHTKKDSVLEIHVEDNGQGIAPEHQGKIFEMFFRANENAQGSGLGLYIVRETLAKLGAEITFDSTYGAGSIFTVKFNA